MPNQRDRAAGCILGGAIGDAMGGPYEGRQPPVLLDTEAEWRISDDTQLTLATCEAVDRTGCVSPERIAERFLEWYRSRRLRGLGSSTLKALRDLEAGAHWAMAGRRGERAAGNGAAMRAAPLAFCLDPEIRTERVMLRDICRITHHSDEAYAGALAVVEAIRLVVSGRWQPGENLTRQVAARLPDTSVRDALTSLGKLPPGTPLLEVGERFGCSGFVVESVPLAILASQRVAELGFEAMLAQVIGAGGDTDTIASMAGQIAGAWLGLGELPGGLLGKLPGAESIREAALAFAERVRTGER